jgi:hypothetical protein
MITSFDFAGVAALAVVVIIDCCVEDIAFVVVCVVHVRKVDRSQTLK